MAVLSYLLSCILMISMGKESAANLLNTGVIWVENFTTLYICMVAITFFLIDAELRSSVELLAYAII
jgi:hypothetical protein